MKLIQFDLYFQIYIYLTRHVKCSNNGPWALIRDVRLFIQNAFRVGAYSRRALIRDVR